MPCTTILVGKDATYNGSTVIARNDDAPSGTFTPKSYAIIHPEDQPHLYRSRISGCEIPLPEKPMRYTALPNADPEKEGLWAAGGINEANAAMTSTETITTNSRVLGADPLVPTGIGEEDMVTLVLPYIRTAREGVLRLGSLLETYGTYESNGIAFSDRDEIWYMETIGGHHWIARRLPDDAYAVIANEFGIDTFDLEDAAGPQDACMASQDIQTFIRENHLDLNMEGPFNARQAFGSHTHIDHLYNTPRLWAAQQYFNPTTIQWKGDTARFTPVSDNLPWCQVPEFKITVADVKTVLANTYQTTPYDPYENGEKAGLYRPIGINRTDCTGLFELRNGVPDRLAGICWITFACNVYNVLVPQFAQVNAAPPYFSHTPEVPDTASFYWANRLISALADPCHNTCMNDVRAYRMRVSSSARHILSQAGDDLEQANQAIADLTRKETDQLLAKVLYIASMNMRNAYSMSDN